MVSSPGGPGMDAVKYLRKLIAVPVDLQQQYPVFREIERGNRTSKQQGEEALGFEGVVYHGDEVFAVQEASEDGSHTDCSLVHVVHEISHEFVGSIIEIAVRNHVSSKVFEDGLFQTAIGDESAPLDEASTKVQDAAWIEEQLKSMKVEVDEQGQVFSQSLDNYLSMRRMTARDDETVQSVAVDGPNDKGVQCSCKPRTETRTQSRTKVCPKVPSKTRIKAKENHAASSRTHTQPCLRQTRRKQSVRTSTRVELDRHKSKTVAHCERRQCQDTKLPLVFTADGRLRAWRTTDRVLRPKVPEALRARLTPCK